MASDFDPPPQTRQQPGFSQQYQPQLTQPHRKPNWVEDSQVDHCFQCQDKFTFFTRRHHCRLCGQIFCNDCTFHRKLLPVYFGVAEPQRVCSSCAHELEPQQAMLKRTITNAMRSNALKPGMYTGEYRRYLNNPVKWDLGSEIRKAAWIIRNQMDGAEANMPGDGVMQESVFDNALGLVIMTTVQGGMIGSMRFGTGLVVFRVNDSWSAPCAIKTFALGFGALIGLETTDHILVLRDHEALKTFTTDVSAATGGEASLAIGPYGRTAHADMRANSQAIASVVSYSHSRGIYGGVSVELSGLSVRDDVNRNFYGTAVHARDLLEPGMIEPPPAAQPLYDSIDDLFAFLRRRRIEAEAMAAEQFRQQPPYRQQSSYTAGATQPHGAGAGAAAPPPTAADQPRLTEQIAGGQDVTV